jgi:hypothetical protein
MKKNSLCLQEVSGGESVQLSFNGVAFKDRELVFCPPSVGWHYSIPDGVERIRRKAFHRTDLVSISIPGSVSEIDSAAFEDSFMLETIRLPPSVSYIGDSLFKGCGSLSRVALSDALSEMPEHLFQGCKRLRRLRLPVAAKEFHHSCFHGCESLSHFKISSKNKWFSTERGVLYNKKKTKLIRCPPAKPGTVLLPGSVSEIEWEAFKDCRKISRLVLPEKLADLDPSILEGCDSLHEILVSTNHPLLSSMDGVLLGKHNTTIKRFPPGRSGVYHFPKSVERIDVNAFRNCKKISEVVVSPGIVSIMDGAFAGCQSLMHLALPEGVKELWGWTFAGCRGLRSIRLPESLNYIGESCFINCTSLQSVVVPSGVTEIGRSAFDGCSALRELVLHQNLQALGPDCFSGCTNLERVVIPRWCSTYFEKLFPASVNSLKIVWI